VQVAILVQSPISVQSRFPHQKSSELVFEACPIMKLSKIKPRWADAHRLALLLSFA
jgi:hypothetical protein